MNKLFSTILFLVLSTTTFSQYTGLNLPSIPIENVIIHTDRDLYLTGEKIWFKANCFVSEEDISHNMSNILYVELFNKTKENIVRRKFEISNGMSYGSIDIPSEFSSGNFFIRAYTQYLKNYPVEYYSTKALTVVNPSIALDNKAKATNGYSKIKLVTDNNILLSGIQNNIAFQIERTLFLHTEQAMLLDGEETLQSDIEIFDNGIGIINLTPEQNHHYYFQLITDGGDTLIEALPEVSDFGLKVKSTWKNINQLRLNIVNKPLMNKDLDLIIKTPDFETIYTDIISLNNEEIIIEVDDVEFNKGIYYLLIKDGNSIVNSSAIYCNATFEDKIALDISKTSFSPRELINFDISSKNIDSTGFVKLSVAVSKKGTNQSYEVLPNYVFVNPILLNSYLKSTNLNKFSNKEIEILLLFLNRELNNGDYLDNMSNPPSGEFTWIPETRDVSISGVVINKATNTPAPKIPVYFSAFKENPQIHLGKSDQNGNFVFSISNLLENQNIYLCTETPELNNFEIRVNNDFANTYPHFNDFDINIDSTKRDLLEDLFINTQAGKVFRTETGKTAVKHFNYPFNFAEPQISIKMDDYISTPSLETALNEFIPSARTHFIDGKKTLSITNSRARTTYHYPLILVDNIPIFDVEQLLEIRPVDIDQIDIFKFPLILGDNFINGVFRLSTKSNNFGGIELPESAIFFEYQTIATSYAFDPEAYDNVVKQANKKADFRNLLYWEPNIMVNNNESAQISFYASDHCSEYDIIVSGIDNQGNAFVKSFPIRIEK